MDQLCRIDTQSSTSTRSSTGSPVDSESSHRSFEFINLTTNGPPARDVGQRKVVRAHVVKDFSRKRKLQRLQSEKLKGRKIQPSIPLIDHHLSAPQEQRTQYSHSPVTQTAWSEKEESPIWDAQTAHDQPTVAEERPYQSVENPDPILDYHPDPFSHDFSISGIDGVSIQTLHPDPQLTTIVHHVRNMGAAMFPLSTMFKFNPICSNGPVGWDLDDKAAYHGIMYVTSTYANLLSERTESNEAMTHMSKVVTMVNSRLQNIGLGTGSEHVTESLIGAVASIALAEGLRGNIEGWKIHISGVDHLVRMFGGMPLLSLDLCHKLYRADLMGATAFLLPPRFTGPDNTTWHLPSQSITKASSETINSPLSLLSALSISDALMGPLLSLSSLCTTLSEILADPTPCPDDQRAQVLEATYSIQYYLLRDLQETQAWSLSSAEECLKVIALLYLHATWQDFPLSAMGTTKLLEQLKQLITHTDFDGDAEEHLLVYLLFIGAISARKGDARIWFVANIQRLLGTLRLDTWAIVRAKMSCLWWIESIHEKLCKEVYEEVMVLNGVLLGRPMRYSLE